MRYPYIKNMSDSNVPPTIDLTKITSFVNERDLKLWKQQAVAKYTKIKYDQLCKENEEHDKKINKYEQKIKKAENKLPTVTAVVEQMAESITIASRAIDHLIKRKIDTEHEIADVKIKYENMMERYLRAYEHEKERWGKSNPLYKDLNELTVAVEKSKIHKMMLEHSVKEQKKMTTLKEEINCKILNSNIIDFVMAVKYAQDLDITNKELAEKKILAQNLLKTYKEQNSRKVYMGCQKPITQANQLPKLSLQVKPAPELIKFNMPTISVPMQVHAKSDTIPKIDEANLLNELKQRSKERQKLREKAETSRLFAPNGKRIQSVCPRTTTDTDKNDVYMRSENNEIKQTAKIKVLQNMVISKEIDAPKGNMVEKRQSNGEIGGKMKKTKRVSFGECYSQEDQVGKPDNDSEHGAEEVSAFFSKQNNKMDNLPEKQNIFSAERTAQELTATNLQLECDTSGFLKNLSSPKGVDDTFLSFKNTAENTFDNNQSDNPFLWSQPTSQQNFGGNFSLF